VSGSNKRKTALRYRVDRSIRAAAMRLLSWITRRSSRETIDFRPQKITKILLVRSLFRMGDAILATPAILLLRRNFPAATIDFVGSSMSKQLFKNLPIDRHYEVHRSFPKVCWSYLMLLKQIRDTRYDLAFDASGSSAALGSFIVGFSAARLRVGLRGKWDRWFNVRLHRPATKNKYRILPELVRSLGLESPLVYPRLFLSPEELQHGGTRIRSLIECRAPVVGIFVGGRKARGKRWARQNFLELATRLRGAELQPVIFVGPEEHDLFAHFQQALRHRAPVLFEPDVRSFASLVANCHLFVACDSGPVHLACALRVRTVAIFLKDDFKRWGPPSELGRIVCPQQAASADGVFEACRLELLKASAAGAQTPSDCLCDTGNSKPISGNLQNIDDSSGTGLSVPLTLHPETKDGSLWCGNGGRSRT
jgi:lipopolysaccharide heptosyltransferase II